MKKFLKNLFRDRYKIESESHFKGFKVEKLYHVYRANWFNALFSIWESCGEYRSMKKAKECIKILNEKFETKTVYRG